MTPTPARQSNGAAKRPRLLTLSLLCASVLAPAAALAADWYQWRGPEQNGVSREKNLPETWDPDTGENVVWKNNFGGMSSPIVMKGKVYALTRVGDVEAPNTVIAGPQTQEALVCVDANTGKTIWQHAENMFQTDLPFHRLGWANPTGDPESNRVYAYGAQGVLYALDADTGKEVWKRSMSEDFGMISTFGGRTPSPAVDEDQLFIGGVAFGWGDHAKSQYRVFCLDKNTGELRWSNGTGGIPVDAPYQTPVIAVINGERLVITGAGDGSVTAFQARTGKKAWSCKVSKRGLNASVVVDGNNVYACSSEENLKGNRMGTVVCIDAANLVPAPPGAAAPGGPPPGPQPKEVWRRDGIESGFGSPTIFDGRLYVIDNSGGVHALDAKTGETYWRKKVGTIGKPSLVYADGKIYAPEANGRMNILEVGDKKAEVLSKVEVGEKLGREYVIFGSVAVANGRIYLQSATSTFCIGNKDAQPQASADAVPQRPQEEPAAQDAKPSQILVLPADAVLRQGGSQKFRAVAFDDKGRRIGDVNAAEWSIGKLTFEAPPRALPVAPTDREAPPGGQPNAAVVPPTPGETQASGAEAATGQPKNPDAEDKPDAGAAQAGAVQAGAQAQPAAAAPPQPEKIQIGNLYGQLSPDGGFVAPDNAGALLGGAIVAKAGGVSGYARVRVVPPFPWTVGFTNAGLERPPLTWIGAGGKFAVQALKGDGDKAEKVLTKLTNIDLYARARTYLGTADMANYTVQADVRVDSKKVGGRDQIPDVGVINSRYTLLLYGNHQRAELHSWQPAVPLHTHQTINYKWEPGRWYTLKLRVDQEGEGKAVVRGKVWLRDGQEPSDWTLTMEDSLPNRHGSPGLFGNSLVTPFQSFVYYDNILVTDNKQGHANAAR